MRSPYPELACGRLGKSTTWLFFSGALLLLLAGSGCDSASDGAASLDADVSPHLVTTKAPPSKYKFEPAVMLTVEGKPISVESPGYACPTVADIDGDGVDDLIVGQFSGGKMKWYRNTASPTESPRYAAGKWIKCGSSPAQVPGVS